MTLPVVHELLQLASALESRGCASFMSSQLLLSCLETKTKIRQEERLKVTLSPRSGVQYRPSLLYRTYAALHIRHRAKVWQIKSSFPHSRFTADLPSSQLSFPLKGRGTDVGEEEVFCYTLWSSFHQPLRCLLPREAGPALDRAHSVTGPAPSSRTESIWEDAVPLWGVPPGLQLKSDCTPTVSDQIISPYNSYVGGFPGGPVVETPCFQTRGLQFDPWSGN